MNKKIKRYGNSFFSNRRHNSWKTVGWIAALCVLAVAGYFLAQLVLNPPPKAPEDPSTPAGETPSGTTSPEPNSQLPDASQTVWSGIRCDTKTFTDQAALAQFLKDAKAKGYQAVYFDAKDSQGKVYFQTQSEVALAADATVSSAVDLQTVAKLFRDNQMIGIPVIHSFGDPLSASRVRKAAIWYNNGVEEFLWLDNYADKGGKAWLNPYSSVARNYLTSLQTELMQAGFTTVLFDAVKFGSGVNNDLSYYGEESKTMSRVDALSRFIKECEAVADRFEGVALFACPVTDLIGEKSTNLDGNFLACNPKALCPVFDLTKLGKELKLDGQTIERPETKPGETTLAVMNYLKKKLPESRLIPRFTDYANLANQQATAIGKNTSCLRENG